jgi:hypothetical protein
MKDLGYKVLNGRGISFIDNKKVKLKGSEIGFSLAKIEKILGQKELLARKNSVEEKISKQVRQPVSDSFEIEKQYKEKQSHPPSGVAEEFAKQNLGILGQLMNVEYTADYVNPELENMLQKKKKKLSLRR